jgi:hypothetical protein
VVLQHHARRSSQGALGHHRAVRLVRVRERARLEAQIVSIAAIAKARENSRCPRGRHRWGTRTGSPASSVSLGKMLVNRRMYLELVDEHAGVEVVVNRARAARRRARRHRRAVRLHLVLQRPGLRGTVSAQFSLSKTPGAHVVGPGACAARVRALVAREDVDEHTVVAVQVQRAVAAGEAMAGRARDGDLLRVAAREAGHWREGRRGGEGGKGGESGEGDHDGLVSGSDRGECWRERWSGCADAEESW